MSRTLNLADRLLALARLFEAMGRSQDALRLLARLAGFRNLPTDKAAETQARLGRLHLRRGRYKQARRHLAAALAYRPDNATYHYQLATAYDQDEDGDPQTAFVHYRQALDLKPDQPDCLADFGLLAICLGNDEDGLKSLRKAADLAPADPDILGKLLEGLCQLERPQEARFLLRDALFRNPRHSGFRKLWSDFRFQRLREEQEAARRSDEVGQGTGTRRMLLPFLRPTDDVPTPAGRKRFRFDGASLPAPPHIPWPVNLPDRKHA
jgi:tetratricopeptide (TPR) repeat protein